MENQEIRETLAGLIIVGIVIYFIVFIPSTSPPEEEKYEWDTNEPYSQIQSPPTGSLQTGNFQIKVLDEDLESGIKEGSCQYKVISYNDSCSPYSCEHSTGWKSRKCNSYQTISVGPEGDCCFEGRKNCYIYVRCQDKAGNWGRCRESELSIRYYSISWTNSRANKTVIEEKNYEDKIEIVNVFKIIDYFSHTNRKNHETMNFLDSQNTTTTILQKNISFAQMIKLTTLMLIILVQKKVIKKKK